jgi:hypothetical protein
LRRPVAEDEPSELGRRVSFFVVFDPADAARVAAGFGAVFGGEDSSIELDADELVGEREVETPPALGMELVLELGPELHDGEVAE